MRVRLAGQGQAAGPSNPYLRSLRRPLFRSAPLRMWRRDTGKGRARAAGGGALKDAHARKPINKTARLVVSRGFHFDSRKINGCVASEVPPTSMPRPHDVPDLTGRRVGRMTVIAYCGRVRKKSIGGHGKTIFYWSVRCDCGLYSVRRHRAILRQSNAEVDACERCRHLRHLQHDDRYRREAR